MDTVVNNKPLVSVILPVYNAELYLFESIQSILNQTYTNFELIVINDGSSDNSLNIIHNFKDKRLILINNNTNKGIVVCLNSAISISKGELIARMDADDISLPNRLEIQLHQFLKNTNLILCGSYYNIIYKNIELKTIELPVNNNEIKSRLIFNNQIAHPSVMFRKSLWVNNQYSEHDFGCEDYGLWLSSQKQGEYYNIPIPLIKYRVHSANISLKSSNKLDNSLFFLRKKNLSEYFNYTINDNFSNHVLRKIYKLCKKENIKNNFILDEYFKFLIQYNVSFYNILFIIYDINILLFIRKYFIQKYSNFHYNTKIKLIERGYIHN